MNDKRIVKVIGNQFNENTQPRHGAIGSYTYNEKLKTYLFYPTLKADMVNENPDLFLGYEINPKDLKVIF